MARTKQTARISTGGRPQTGPMSKDPDYCQKNGSENPQHWRFPNRPPRMRYPVVASDGTLTNGTWAEWDTAIEFLNAKEARRIKTQETRKRNREARGKLNEWLAYN